MESLGLTASLVGAAAGLAFVHTLLGPDHYLPFVMLAKARRWSLTRTVMVTVACGLGHVASSLLLGGLGVAFGLAVGWFEGVEAGRGDLAAWALVAFGIAYAAWGLRLAMRSRHGLEPHDHHGHVHLHTSGAHPHRHGHSSEGSNTTFWTLFVIFVLGPCEPLIPLFVLPASRGSWGLAAVAAAVFGLVTVVTMTVITVVGVLGVSRLRLGWLEPWSHAIAGCVVAVSGLAVLFLGL